MARLQIYDGEERLRQVELGRDSVRVGRDDTNGIVLEDPSVSRRHAEIEPTGNFYLVRDSGSTNGTYVNDLLVRVRLLAHGDVIRVGRYLLRVDARPSPGTDSTRVRIERLGLPGRERERGKESQGGDEGVAGAGAGAAPGAGEASEAGAAELLERLEELRALLGHVDDRAEIHRRSADFLFAAFDADHAGVLLLDRQKRRPPAVGDLRHVAGRARGEETASPEQPVDIRMDERLLEEALFASEPVSGRAPGDEGRAALAAALIDEGRCLGVLWVDRAAPFDEAGRRLLELVARETAVALANARLLEDVLAERGKVQAIFTSLVDGVLVTDRELRVTDANIAAAVLLGLEEHNPLGRELFDLFDRFEIAPAAEILRSEALEGVAVFRLTRSGSDPDGERSLAGQILPWPRGGASWRGFVVVLRDATQARRLEQLKGEFIGNVAHKLRSPLTVIEADLPMLREGAGTPGVASELLDEIERNSNLLCHLVDQFVEYTDLEMQAAGRSEGPATMRPARLVQEAVEAKAGLAREREVDVEVRVGEDLPPLTARSGALRDALERVLDNAIKFSEAGGRVLIDAESASGSVRFHVTDQGPGIPPEEVDAVFYLGHQVDRQRTGQVPGAGLGLTIARHEVRQHGGEIRIRSPIEADRGTRVSIVLPVGAADGTSARPRGRPQAVETSHGH